MTSIENKAFDLIAFHGYDQAMKIVEGIMKRAPDRYWGMVKSAMKKMK